MGDGAEERRGVADAVREAVKMRLLQRASGWGVWALEHHVDKRHKGERR